MKKVTIFLLVCLLCCALILPISASASVADDVPSPYTVWRDDYIPWGYATITKSTVDGSYTLWLSQNSPVYYSSTGKLYFNNGFATYSIVNGEWGNYTENMSSSASLDKFLIKWASADIFNDSGGYSFYHDPNVFEKPSIEVDPTPDEEQSLISSILNPIGKWFTQLGDTLLEGIKDMFVPSADAMDATIDHFLSEISVITNVDTSYFENLFKEGKPIEDVYVDYDIPNVGKINFKVFDAEIFVDGFWEVRDFVRGFLVLLLFLYHIRQLIGFFGYNAGVVAGRNEEIKGALEAQKK